MNSAVSQRPAELIANGGRILAEGSVARVASRTDLVLALGVFTGGVDVQRAIGLAQSRVLMGAFENDEAAGGERYVAQGNPSGEDVWRAAAHEDHVAMGLRSEAGRDGAHPSEVVVARLATEKLIVEGHHRGAVDEVLERLIDIGNVGAERSIVTRL